MNKEKHFLNTTSININKRAFNQSGQCLVSHFSLPLGDSFDVWLHTHAAVHIKRYYRKPKLDFGCSSSSRTNHIKYVIFFVAVVVSYSVVLFLISSNGITIVWRAALFLASLVYQTQLCSH